jgi:hypothetical protein
LSWLRRRGRHCRFAQPDFIDVRNGELGNVGTAAAVANSVYHATGIRVRDLPIRLEKLIA